MVRRSGGPRGFFRMSRKILMYFVLGGLAGLLVEDPSSIERVERDDADVLREVER
jgi:hypothetical protein